MKNIIKSAVFSPCRKYRYSLSRTWDINQKIILFIGLNPSTANETHDDPTIRRCLLYSSIWGFGGLIIVNLFAFRATLPKDLINSKHPVGRDNNQFIIHAHKEASMTIAAWGNDGDLYNRDQEVLEIISNPMCLKVNKTGQPAHPLYQKKDIKQKPYSI